MTHDGPSSEDLDRFGGETAYCPECSEEIWDQAGVCPVCGSVVGETVSRPPPAGRRRRLWFAVVAVIVLLAFAWAILGRW